MKRKNNYVSQTITFQCEIIIVIGSMVLLFFKALLPLLAFNIIAFLIKYFTEGLRIANILLLFAIYLITLPVLLLKLLGICVLYVSIKYFPVYWIKPLKQ